MVELMGESLDLFLKIDLFIVVSLVLGFLPLIPPSIILNDR
jgi:hypothetical protein